MRKKYSLCFAIIYVGLIASNVSWAVKEKTTFRNESIIAPHKSGHLLIKRSSNVRRTAAARWTLLRNLQVVTKLKSLGNFEVVKLPAGMSIKEGMKALENDPGVESVAPDYFLYATELPNDASFAQQWALNNTAQSGGKVDVDVNAPEAWLKSIGVKETVVGVIDTGVNYLHKDLAANMWVNTAEIPDNKIDDDNNGYVDDVHGINAITDTGDPMDDNGHGSHVAGIIGAEGNNALGISGIMQKTSIIGCKFLTAQGSGSSSNALKCLDYFAALATREKDKVFVIATNNSWAGGGYSAVMEDAIRKHMDAGILFMAAASNEGNNNDQVETYPTNYPLANIISVGAIDHNGELASFSNYGKYSVDVSAPGVAILSTMLGEDGYKSLSGTSMATPYVTGLAGLISSFNPQLNWKQIKNLIISSGVASDNLADKSISGRRIRAFDENGVGALSCDKQKLQRRLSPKHAEVTLPLGSNVPVSLLSIECANAGEAPLALVNGLPMLLSDDGTKGDNAANDGLFTGSFAPKSAGNYELSFFNNEKVNAYFYDMASWKQYRVSEDKTYNYREFTGTALPAFDDGARQIKAPFPLKFASNESGFTAVNVGDNGVLSVTDEKRFSWENQELPFASAVSVVAPFWDDLSSENEGAAIQYGTLGQAPNREFVIEWKKVKHYSLAADDLTFQVVFFENSSNILFNYKDVELSVADISKGASATVGIQIGKENALQLSYNKASLSNESSILFVENTPPVAVAGAAKVVLQGEKFTLDASQSYDLDGDKLTFKWKMLGKNPMTFVEQSSPLLQLDSRDLSGDYTFELTVSDGTSSAVDSTMVTVIDMGPINGPGDPFNPPFNDELVQPFSLPHSFNRNLAPTAPFLFNSAVRNNNYLTVANASDPESDALKYNFYVSESAAFKNTVAQIMDVQEGPDGTTSVLVDKLNLDRSRNYFWYSTATDSSGNKSGPSAISILPANHEGSKSAGGCGGNNGSGNTAFVLLALFLLPKRRAQQK